MATNLLRKGRRMFLFYFNKFGAIGSIGLSIFVTICMVLLFHMFSS